MFFGAFAGGLVSSFATDVYNATKKWLLSPSLPITIPQVTSIVIGVIGIALTICGHRKQTIAQSEEVGDWEKNILKHGSVSSENGKIILSIKREGRSYAMVYSKTHNSLQRPIFKMRAQVTPLTLYRFALGVWTAVNPNNSLNRLAILEVDNDAFRLTYTGVRGQQHMLFSIPTPREGETYKVELEIWEYPYVAYGRIYRGEDLLQEVRAEGLGLPYLSNDVFIGVAVWTDAVSCPLSRYVVEGLEIV